MTDLQREILHERAAEFDNAGDVFASFARRWEITPEQRDTLMTASREAHSIATLLREYILA